MNGSILMTIKNGQVEMFLNCAHEEEETLAPIMSEIRRVVEGGLESVGADGLVACVRD